MQDEVNHRLTEGGWLLFSACGLAITEPVLRVFGATPALFSHHNVDSLFWIVCFAAVVLLAPPLLCFLVVALASVVGTRLMRGVTVVLLALLAMAWGIQLARWTLGIDSVPVVVGVGLICATVFVIAIDRWPALRGYMKVLALVPLVSVLMFLGTSQTASLVSGPVDEEVSTETADLPSVLFVLLDEFPTHMLLNPEGGIHAGLYPNLATLASESTWYRNYTVLAESTAQSVPSLLSGQRPSGRIPTAKNYPSNLFALLAPTHHLTAYETITKLCVYSTCSLGPPGSLIKPEPSFAPLVLRAAQLWQARVTPWSSRDLAREDFKEALVEASPTEDREKNTSETNTDSPDAVTGQKQKNIFELLFTPEKLVDYAKAKPQRFERFRRTILPNAETSLYFLHLELPHIPFRFYASGAVYDSANARLSLTNDEVNKVEWTARVTEYRFAKQAAYTDALMGDLFSQLKAQGIWDDLLIVVTADHGRAFGYNTSPRRVSKGAVAEIAYVPLFIKLPGQDQGRVDDSNLMAFDLIPTIADILNLSPSWQMAGLAAGDDAVLKRGDEKFIFPSINTGPFRKRLGKALRYSQAEQSPVSVEARLATASMPEQLFSVLLEPLDVVQYIGVSSNQLASSEGGAVKVEDLPRLINPGDQHPLGMVMGSLVEPRGLEAVLVGINGTIVSASPLFTYGGIEGTFLAMLPEGILRAENTLELFGLQADEIYRLKSE